MTTEKKHKKLWTKLLLVSSVIGPGIIAGTADNDAGGIATYSVAGAQFGYHLIWVLFLITFVLAITQEMGARLGIVSGKGLAALIRENFPFKATFLIISLSFIANWANILADVAGMSAVANIYGIPAWLFVLSSAALLSWLVISGNFKNIQRVFLTSSLMYFAYVFAGFMIHPDWTEATKSIVVPSIIPTPEFLFMAIALIGTTVTIWGQFFVQSYFAEKGVRSEDLPLARLDVATGALWTNFVAFFIIVATAGTLYVRHISITDAADAALALEPFAGAMAKHLFAWGLYNAAMLGAGVVTISTAYTITEAFGWEGKINAGFKESSAFYKIFLICIFSASALVLVPNFPIVPVLVASQALNTFILPILFIFLLRLLNRADIMGKHKNGLWSNVFGWVSIVGLSVLNLAYFVYLIVSKFR
ncbi:MAG: divalent metal cation transporter [Candidatus Magasanikbacteria bacterium]|nr:divalent metal cation transporter [Candidatus Magasanikbacteria bacterium]